MAFSQAITNRRDALRSQKEKLLNELAQSQVEEHEADSLADSENEACEKAQKEIVDAEERIDDLLDLLQQARMLTAEYKKAASMKLANLKNKYAKSPSGGRRLDCSSALDPCAATVNVFILINFLSSAFLSELRSAFVSELSHSSAFCIFF